MTMKIMFGTALAATAMMASPAMAKTFDIATGFGSSVFTYGQASTTTGAIVNPAVATNCSDISVTSACYRVPGTQYQIVAKTPGATSGTTLLVHPENSFAQNSALVFTAPVASIYTFNFNFTKDVNSIDGINLYKILSGIGYVTHLNSGDTYNLSFSAPLAMGQAAGFAVNYGNPGSIYYGDSTFVSGTVSYVPEPATWAMMILGMGAVGFAMRRRSAVRTSVRYA